MRHWQKHMSVTKPMLQREKREKEGLNQLDFSDYYNILIGYQPGEEYQELIDHMVNNSAIQSRITPQSSDKILTLSTCTGQGYEKRFAIHAVCVDTQSADVK